jgi:hypothetical protein
MKAYVCFLVTFIILTFNISFETTAQFYLFKIETINKIDRAVDYWIFDTRSGGISPLWMEGFSKTDFNECLEDSLVLFNFSKAEDFGFDRQYLLNVKQVRESIRSKSKLYQKKKVGNKDSMTTVRIYCLPVFGKFLFCHIFHAKGNTLGRIGYEGVVALPIGDVEIDSKSRIKEDERIDKIDFVNLPSLQLSKIQW